MDFADVLGPHVSLAPSRIAAQIVSGIGFVGGGLIFVRDAVRALTTASVVWVTAAVGAAAGAGMVVVAVAATAAHRAGEVVVALQLYGSAPVTDLAAHLAEVTGVRSVLVGAGTEEE